MDNESIKTFDSNRMGISELLFATVLEECLLQLKIIEGSTMLRSRHWSINPKTEKRTWDKLISDRKIVSDALRKTIIDIIEGNKYQYLQKVINNLKQRLSAKTYLQSLNENEKGNYEALKLQLETSRSEHSLLLREADKKIAQLKDKLKDDQLNATIRFNYADKWLSAKAESLDFELTWEPKPAPRADYEDRVHRELMHAYELQIKDLEKKLEYWRVRYGDDTSRISVIVSDQREQYERITARRRDLQARFNEHEEAINAWLTFKKERAEKLASEKRLNDAATHLQAWWRGVMVRRGMGQFKNLKNSKKAPSKSKKK